MNLDLRTEFYFAITSLMVVALGLVMLWWRDRSASLRDWAIAICFGLFGNAIAGSHFRNLEGHIAADPQRGADWLALAGLIMITTSYVLAVRGLVRHFDDRWNGRIWLIFSLSTAGFLWFMWPERNGTAWAVISCYTRAVLCASMLRICLRNRRRITPD